MQYEVKIVNYLCNKLNSIMLKISNISENKTSRENWFVPSVTFKIYYNLLSDEIKRVENCEGFMISLREQIINPPRNSDIYIIKEALMTVVEGNRDTITWRNFPIYGTDINWSQKFLNKRKVEVLNKLTIWMTTPVLLRMVSHQVWDPMYTVQ